MDKQLIFLNKKDIQKVLILPFLLDNSGAF